MTRAVEFHTATDDLQSALEKVGGCTKDHPVEISDEYTKTGVTNYGDACEMVGMLSGYADEGEDVTLQIKYVNGKDSNKTKKRSN